MTSDNRVDVTIAMETDAEAVEPEALDKSAQLAINERRVQQLVGKILDLEKVEWSTVNVVFSTHETIRELNRRFLNHDYDTDVLSFVIDKTMDGLEGEIYVDFETAEERHCEFNSSLQSELERYVAHGALHLAGYSDGNEEEKNRMHTLEDHYLGLLT